MSAARRELTYVLPIKWSPDLDRDEITDYLRRLGGMVDEIIVADGSDDRDLEENRRAWGGLVRHVVPHDDVHFANGKVDGVTTGVRLASHEKVVIADDDVRYDTAALERVAAELDRAELVRPQNYFAAPMPWHALWDTSRVLLNRCFGADFPGTFGLRRSFFLQMGGYDGNVMFENLELIRTVEASGGRVSSPPDLYVERLPSTTERFASQRVRQAYDELALPARLLLWLSVLPGLAWVAARRETRAGLAFAAATVAAAEVGRRKAGGRAVFPARATLFAPAWVLERGLCIWPALWQWATGGVRYGGGRIKKAAHRYPARRYPTHREPDPYLERSARPSPTP